MAPVKYGFHYEEIGMMGEGALHAELIRNRSFEEATPPAGSVSYTHLVTRNEDGTFSFKVQKVEQRKYEVKNYFMPLPYAEPVSYTHLIPNWVFTPGQQMLITGIMEYLPSPLFQ